MSLRVLVVEPHQLVRQGLEAILSVVGNIELVGVVDTGDQAVTRCQAESIDIVLIEVNLGKSMTGIEAIRRIKEHSPDTKVLVLTMFTDPGTVAEAVIAGADGYLSKSASGEAVVQAIFDVAEGRPVVDPDVTEGIFGRISGKDPRALSARELTVLQELGHGKSTREVAEHIHVSEEAVKTLVEQIFRKLGVRNRFQWRDPSDPRHLLGWNFDFPDPRNQMVALLLFLALTAVLVWSLSRSELFG